MSTRELLTELADLLQAQVGHVVSGNHQALMDGAARHEAIVEALSRAESPEPDDELRELVRRIDRDQAKLQELLAHESARADFFLRLCLGGVRTNTGAAGYPPGIGKGAAKNGSGLFNTRA